MEPDLDRYRVFISYSHDSERDMNRVVDKIASVLRQNMLTPVWDKDIRPASNYRDEIKKLIAHAHIFMPLLTAAASAKGWVHQELGYALALNIPVFPVSIDMSLPAEMIEGLQKQDIPVESIDNAAEKLNYSYFKGIVSQKKYVPTYTCEQRSEGRAARMAEMANFVREINRTGIVRQKGGLSSFHIPDEPFTDPPSPAWVDRYYPTLLNETHCELQHAERVALEHHAREAGCKLVINPYLTADPKRYHPIAQKARLEALLHFLLSAPEAKTDVLIDKRLSFDESVTIVGNWFSAESYSRSDAHGFKHTLFSEHAPGIGKLVQTFDADFQRLLRAEGLSEGRTLQSAIAEIRRLLDEIRIPETRP